MVKIFPVVLCGGSGLRLWPESRLNTPKQFLRLLGAQSPFQEAILRVAPLASTGGQIIVVAGEDHRANVETQVAEIGVEVQLIVEPVGRNSGPAVTAAALWSLDRDPTAINAIVASDHLIPEAAAFRRAVLSTVEAAVGGRIVTLGIAPRFPSSAYGYIRSSGISLSPVVDFVEKPNVEFAERLIAGGYFWNSGNFVASAKSLVSEVDAHCPSISLAVRRAVGAARTKAGALILGPDFGTSPTLSFDHAVMEKTMIASVLPVHFEWSDIGDWEAIANTGRGSKGRSVQIDCADLLVRAPEGTTVVTIGVQRLAVVVTNEGVLVCPLNRSQDVKAAVDQMENELTSNRSVL